MEASCQDEKNGSLNASIKNRIFDGVGLLTPSQKESLFRVIQNLEIEVGSQIGIVIIDTLEGKEINAVSLQIAEKLNLGRNKYRDGLLIFVAFRNHQMRIEVGYGLERIIKDEIASRIIREKISPRFRKQEYYEGLSAAVIEINRLVTNNRSLVGKNP